MMKKICMIFCTRETWPQCETQQNMSKIYATLQIDHRMMICVVTLTFQSVEIDKIKKPEDTNRNFCNFRLPIEQL